MNNTIRIFPIVVLYREQLHNASTYQTLLKDERIEQFMVCDNSPLDFEVNDEAFDSRAIYVRNLNNLGLSYCYNQAAHYAKETGYSHLLILDQDTYFPPTALNHYFQIQSWIPVAAPCLSSRQQAFSPVDVSGWNLRGTSLEPGIYSLRKFSPVNSGLCVQLTAFFQAGGYDESVYLDYADFVFVHRLSQIVPTFQLLAFTAQQDFSNHNPSSQQLIQRLRHYLHSAAQIKSKQGISSLKILYQTLRHTTAISLRTGSLTPFVAYLLHFILKRNP